MKNIYYDNVLQVTDDRGFDLGLTFDHATKLKFGTQVQNHI